MSDHDLARNLAYVARAGWVRAKDVLGLPRRGDRSFYLDQFARRLKRGDFTPGQIAVTVAGRTDGAGSQAQAVMSGLAFARAFSLPYVHTPFTVIDHPERPMADWVRAWEDLFAFAASSDANFDAPTIFLGDFLRDRRARARTCAVALPHYLRWSNENVGAYAAIAPDLRRHFRPSRNIVREGRIVVAAHVRRGDVSKTAYPGSYTPNGDVAAAIETVTRSLRDLGALYVVRVYSQGRAEDFADIAALGCELRLDTSALTTFESLVAADVLIMAKSSFSYSAAILGEGIAIYEPYRQTRPLPDWIVRGPGGALDASELSAKIKRLRARQGAGGAPA